MDIRQSTYAEETKQYAHEAEVLGIVDLDPNTQVAAYNLSPQDDVEISSYPPGTWFYYLDGKTYVREI